MTQCEHGTVHVAIGDVTLRLSTAGLGALADLLVLAQRELGRPEAEGYSC